MWSSDGESIFLNQNLKMILSLNTDAVLSVILKIESENAMKSPFVNWNMENNISLDSSDDTILQTTKITTCDVPVCVAGAHIWKYISFKWV